MHNAQSSARAGAQTPHPPFLETKISYGPSRKCRAFFHSGCNAAARALRILGALLIAGGMFFLLVSHQ